MERLARQSRSHNSEIELRSLQRYEDPKYKALAAEHQCAIAGNFSEPKTQDHVPVPRRVGRLEERHRGEKLSVATLSVVGRQRSTSLSGRSDHLATSAPVRLPAFRPERFPARPGARPTVGSRPEADCRQGVQCLRKLGCECLRKGELLGTPNKSRNSCLRIHPRNLTGSP